MVFPITVLTYAPAAVEKTVITIWIRYLNSSWSIDHPLPFLASGNCACSSDNILQSRPIVIRKTIPRSLGSKALTLLSATENTNVLLSWRSSSAVVANGELIFC